MTDDLYGLGYDLSDITARSDVGTVKARVDYLLGKADMALRGIAPGDTSVVELVLSPQLAPVGITLKAMTRSEHVRVLESERLQRLMAIVRIVHR